MTSPTTFLKIGSFLPSAVLVSVAMMFAGLYEWVNAAWMLDDAPTGTAKEKTDAKEANNEPKWIQRQRPVLRALGILIATHVLGLLVFAAITSSFFIEHWTVRSSTSLHRTTHLTQ
jgi:GPI-anchor transamidase subunit GAA1